MYACEGAGYFGNVLREDVSNISGDFVTRTEVIEGKKEELGAVERVLVFRRLSSIIRIYICLRAHFQL